MNKGLILFLFLFLACANVPDARSFHTSDALNDENGSWTPLNNIVYLNMDEVEVAEGPFSYRFYTINATGWMDFGFMPLSPLNLSAKFLALWLKVQNVTLDMPLTLFLDDNNGNRRGFWNIVSWFALESNTWARITLDMGNFNWEDPGFNVARVIRIRFVAYDRVGHYSQTIWIEDPILASEEEDKEVSSSEQNSLFLILDILFLSTIFCVTGFIVFHFFRVQLPSGWNFAVALPLYMAVGTSALVTLLSVFCLVFLDAAASWCIIASIFVIFVIIIIKKSRCISTKIRSFRTIEFLIPACLFGFSLVRFLLLTLDMKWGAYVDSQTHGSFTSLILFHRGFPSTSYPVGNMTLNPIQYPMGFHASSAFASLVTGVYPGESILLVAVAIVLITPSLFYSIVYLYTKSLKLSFLSFLLSLFLPGATPMLWRNSHDLLLGNLLVGAYPNLLGNLILITVLAATVVLDKTAANSSRQVTLLYGLLIATLGVSYYPLAPFVAGFIFLRAFLFYFRRSRLVLRVFWFVIFLFTIIIFIFVLWSCRPLLTNFLRLDSSLLYTVYMRYPLFELNSPYLAYTGFILVAFFFSLWFLFMDELRNLGLLFLVFFFPLILSQNEQMYSVLFWFIQPDRALILLVGFSYVTVLLGVFELCTLEWVRTKKPKTLVSIWFGKHRIRFGISGFLGWLVVGILLMLFVPSLTSHLTYSYPAQYKLTLPHANDFEALAWFATYVDPSELILNDRTVMGLWVGSFKAMNIVNSREIILEIFLFGSINGTYLYNRTIEINEILDYPWNYDRINEIAKKYNVSYIYLSDNNLELSERGQHVWLFPWTHMTQNERIFIYLQNPYTELIYRSGNAVVFKVGNKLN